MTLTKKQTEGEQIMTKQYIVQTYKLDYGPGEHQITAYEMTRQKTGKQKWNSTHDSLSDAKSALKKHLQDERTMAVFLIEWSAYSGRIETNKYAVLQCAPGAKYSVLELHERAYKEQVFARCGDRIREIKVGPWQKITKGLGKDVALGGGNFITYKPESL